MGVSEGRPIDGGLTLGEGKTKRESAAIGRRGGTARRGRRRGGGKGKKSLANDIRRAEYVDIVGIRQDHATAAYQTLKAAKQRVHANGEELGTQRAALADATTGVDNGWRGAVNAEEKVSGRGIHGGDPG